MNSIYPVQLSRIRYTQTHAHTLSIYLHKIKYPISTWYIIIPRAPFIFRQYWLFFFCFPYSWCTVFKVLVFSLSLSRWPRFIFALVDFYYYFCWSCSSFASLFVQSNRSLVNGFRNRLSIIIHVACVHNEFFRHHYNAKQLWYGCISRNGQ